MTKIEAPLFDISTASVSRRRFLRGGIGVVAARALAPITALIHPFIPQGSPIAAAPDHPSPTIEADAGFSDQFFKETSFWVRDNVEVDGKKANFFREFNRLGGVNFAGYPISRPFIKDGFVYQAFQRQILQWRPELNQAVPANTMDILSKEGKDDWLADKGIPKPITDDGSNGDFEKARQIRNQWMTNPQIKAEYQKAPDPITSYGLPTSKPERRGPFIIQRFQRGALQLWVDKVDDMPKPGTVVGVLAGEFVRDANIFIPQEALITETKENPMSVSITPRKTVEQTNSPEVMSEFKNRVGWAYSARPENDFTTMLTAMKNMKAEGANVVYIGHINPNEVENKPAEPGLGFAVYFARKTGYRKDAQANAENMFQAVMRSLEAAKQAGLAVVLPIGYQIEMGEQWIRENVAHLRKNPDGSNMNHWGNKGVGETASPYSPKYRQDIAEYYNWVQNEIIAKYPNILAINLGDEPMGGDFSTWAKQEFQRTHNNITYDSADPKDRGEFQSGVLADYAAWSANLWNDLNPNLKTMMTFHIQREVPEFPNFEKVFQKTPKNFLIAPDNHMHDAPADDGISASDVNLCYAMSRYIGWLSNVYDRPLMVWTSANDWGLDNKPGTLSGGGINEARENLRIVTDVAKQNGAKIAMVMAWGYNMGEQGLYQGTPGKRPYEADNMFRQISSDMKARRDTLSEQISGRPDIVIYVPADALYRRIDAEKISHVIDRNNPWVDLNSYDFRNQNIVYLTDGPALERARKEGSQIIQVNV